MRDNNLPPVYVIYESYFKEPYICGRLVDEDADRDEFNLTRAELEALDKASDLV